MESWSHEQLSEPIRADTLCSGKFVDFCSGINNLNLMVHVLDRRI